MYTMVASSNGLFTATNESVKFVNTFTKLRKIDDQFIYGDLAEYQRYVENGIVRVGVVRYMYLI